MAELEHFESLVLPHTASMLRAAGALIGWQDAEDAAQEALTRAWRAWPALREVGATRGWLLRITVNVCREWQRGAFGQGLRLTEPLPSDSGSLGVPTAGDLGTSDHTGMLDLRDAVALLDPDLRLIVVLRYYAGMDATEIGTALDMPPATVRTRLRRALGFMRDRMQPEKAQREGGRRNG
jgi:RNA polymerase sigma-70 factor, ECF subfamily